MIKAIHQFYFDFGIGQLSDNRIFQQSNQEFQDMKGWTYKLWTESEVYHLCKTQFPDSINVYSSLIPIQRLDLAKYMVAHTYGGVIVDLDVLPLKHLDTFICQPYLFDRCSRKNIIANDFFYVGCQGLPGIVEYFCENLDRVNKIEIYKIWKMRYIFQTSGPDFFSRYLKKNNLDKFTKRLSTRVFPFSSKRNIVNPDPYLYIEHQLSWTNTLSHVDASSNEEAA